MSTTPNNLHSANHKAGPLIFVVDDEPMLLELASVILEPQGYNVRTFRDPETALKVFNTSRPRPALLVTDYAMHNMNGMQLIEKFREAEPGQKILLVSGTVGEEIYKDSSERPDAFLAKPYLADQFTSAVRTLLGEE